MSKKSLNEAEIEATYVTPALVRAGWEFNDSTATWSTAAALNVAPPSLPGDADSSTPTVFFWIDRLNAGLSASTRMTCANFPGASGQMQVYCLNPATQTWTDVTATIFAGLYNATDDVCLGGTVSTAIGGANVCVPRSDAPVVFAHHYFRTNTGEPSDINTGFGYMQLWVSRLSAAGNPASDYVYLSGAYSENGSPLNGGLVFGRRHTFFMNGLLDSSAGCGFSLLEDSTLGGMFGLGRAIIRGQTVLGLYPAADGIFDRELVARSDFEVMEDYVCARLREREDRVCGGVNVFE
jgi:hypothetical protein